MQVQFGNLPNLSLVKLIKVLVYCWFFHSHPSTICSIAIYQLVLEDRKQLPLLMEENNFKQP